MKKIVKRVVCYLIILSSLLLLPTTVFSVGLFNTQSGVLIIPEVDVNGDTFYENVTLKLDFETGKLELISAETKPETIFSTPLDTMDDKNIKMDFMGCTRSGRNEVTCHLKLTSLGGLDREIRVYGNHHRNQSHLHDDLGGTYTATNLVIGNLESGSSISMTLIAGIPTLAKFKFENISPSASNVSLFKPGFAIGFSDNNFFNGDFRNINF